MKSKYRSFLLCAAVFPAAAFAAGAEGQPSGVASSDPDLPADYLAQILRIERAQYPNLTVTDFTYQDPVRVRVRGREASAPKTEMTEVTVTFTPLDKTGRPTTAWVVQRKMLFSKGTFIRAAMLNDPEVELALPPPPPATDANLPADYREQVRSHLKWSGSRNPFPPDSVTYSDPVRVIVHGTDRNIPGKEMTAIAFNAYPFTDSGESLLAVVAGEALFSEGSFVRLTSGMNDPAVEWIHGKPRVRPDSSEDRKKGEMRILAETNRLHDPVEGPAVRRETRRQLWTRYHGAIADLKIPPDKVMMLFHLLEVRENAQFDAQYLESRKGVDLFSGTMQQAVDAAKAAAESELTSFLGAGYLTALERGAETNGLFLRIINPDDLNLGFAEEGVPLSEGQVRDLDQFCYGIGPQHAGTAYAPGLSKRADRATGLSPFDDAVLEHAAGILSAAQMEILRRDLSNHGLLMAAAPADPRRESLWRWQLQNFILKDSRWALLDLKLPPDTLAQARELLMQEDLAPSAVQKAAIAQGLDIRSDAVKKSEAEARTGAEGRLRTLLGGENFDRLNKLAYSHRMRPVIERSEVANFELEECPLTAEQTEKLESVVEEERSAIKNPTDAAADRQKRDPATDLTPQQKSILDRTSAFLSARQQEVLTVYYADNTRYLVRSESEQPVMKKYPPAVVQGM